MIDAHTHIGWDQYNIIKNRVPQKQSGEELVRKLIDNRIEKAITFPFPFTSYFDLKNPNGKEMEPSGEMKYAYEDQNVYVIKHSRTYDILIPFLAICLGKYDNYDHVKMLVERNPKVRGLKLHSRTSRSPIKELIGSKFMDLARDYKLSLMLHTDSENMRIPTLEFNLMDFSDPMQIIELADKYPDVNIAGAHLGWCSYKFLEEVKKRENLFVDTSPFFFICSSLWRANDALELDYKNPKKALTQICSEYCDSIIWGSDEPYTTLGSNTLDEERKLLNSLEKKTKERISKENTLRYLYGHL